MRKRQGVDIEINTENIKKEIVEIAHISYTPEFFAVDCQPFNEAEKSTSLEIRKSILSAIFAQQPVGVQDLQVVKPKAIAEEDLQRAKELEGEVQVHNTHMQEVRNEATAALDRKNDMQKRVSRISDTLYGPKQRLAQIDRDDEVVSKTSSFDSDWMSLGYLEVESDWDISSVRTQKRDDDDTVHHKQNGRKVTVYLFKSIYGHNGLHCKVTVYTRKKWMHRAEINQLKSSISRKESDLRCAQQEVDSCQKDHDRCQERIKSLRELIANAKRDIREVSGNTMTLEQARARYRI